MITDLNIKLRTIKLLDKVLEKIFVALYTQSQVSKTLIQKLVNCPSLK